MARLTLRIAPQFVRDLDHIGVRGLARGYLAQRLIELESHGLGSEEIYVGRLAQLELYSFKWMAVGFSRLPVLAIWFTAEQGSVMVLAAYASSLSSGVLASEADAVERARIVHGVPGVYLVKDRA